MEAAFWLTGVNDEKIIEYKHIQNVKEAEIT